MVPDNILEENIIKLKSVEKNYDNCNVTIVKMGNKFDNVYLSGKITKPSYYRLSAQNVFPDLDKMLYLDGDTLVYGDLTPLYTLEMEGLYYR